MKVNQWTKSSVSSTDISCVEALLVWRKSSASDASGPWCVEIADVEDGDVLVRDSKLGDKSPILRFTPPEWRAFIGTVGGGGVKGGEFDID